MPLHQSSYATVAVEVLWAEPLASGRYAVRSIPFQVQDIHLYDVVEALGGTPGSRKASECPVVTRVLKRAGHSTFHLTLHTRLGSRPFARIWARLAALGCSFEPRHARAIAIDVPPAASMDRVDGVLIDGEREGILVLDEPLDHHPVAS